MIMGEHKKIKVAFCINDFLVGGAQRLHLGVFAGLDPSRYDMHLITLFKFPNKDDFYAEIPSHIKVHRLSFTGFKDLPSWLALHRLLRSMRPDVVIASLFFANTACRVLKPFLGYAVVATENNTYVDKTRAAIILDRVLSHITFKIIAVSETVRTFTAEQEQIPLEKFMVIRSGIGVQSSLRKAEGINRDATRLALGFGPGARVVVNAARLTRQKNQGALIQAFAAFSVAHPEYKLIIMGEGTKYGEYAKLIRELQAEDRIQLLGNIMDVGRYYAASDFFVSPSHIEGFGIAHVEALAFGLPVLTTKTAGPDEMIREGENGLFISDPSPDSIRVGLEKMASLDLVSMSEACRATADHYDIRHTVALYEKLIEGAAGL